MCKARELRAGFFPNPYIHLLSVGNKIIFYTINACTAGLSLVAAIVGKLRRSGFKFAIRLKWPELTTVAVREFPSFYSRPLGRRSLKGNWGRGSYAMSYDQKGALVNPCKVMK
jgi:hypothetical protein